MVAPLRSDSAFLLLAESLWCFASTFAYTRKRRGSLMIGFACLHGFVPSRPKAKREALLTFHQLCLTGCCISLLTGRSLFRTLSMEDNAPLRRFQKCFCRATCGKSQCCHRTTTCSCASRYPDFPSSPEFLEARCYLSS